MQRGNISAEKNKSAEIVLGFFLCKKHIKAIKKQPSIFYTGLLPTKTETTVRNIWRFFLTSRVVWNFVYFFCQITKNGKMAKIIIYDKARVNSETDNGQRWVPKLVYI